MASNTAQVLSHIPNSGIVQLPGRKFPGVVIQGDTLSGFFDGARSLLTAFKKTHDEERYYEMLIFAEQLRGQLLHYEETLGKQSIGLPYSTSISERLVRDDYGA